MGLIIGDVIPNFTLPGIDGKKHTVIEFKDKKLLLIVFTCNHCPYVQAYEDRLMQIQRDFQNELQLVAINSNEELNYPEDSFEKMVERAKQRDFNFHYLRDKDQSVAKKFSAVCSPHAFLFDENRKLRYKGRIDDNWKDPYNIKHPDLRNAIEDLLNNKEPRVKETHPIGCSIKWQ